MRFCDRSKDYKNKYEESKVPKGTRKRRKSESSESESEQKKSYHDKLKHNDAVKTEKEADNVRSTRHSRRLIGSSDDNTKEDKSISLTLKIEKSGSRDRSPKVICCNSNYFVLIDTLINKIFQIYFFIN